ncbi:hypothetical protein NAL32_17300 [Chryseobacterium sp. Ch-15]|uniref:LysM domain-containing protein n=1 Tax=Chryseobacterium muglaense TaxID=2893752 RepID=A0A9Q3YT64_9FLAO|nr:hypothetical protein [Chryseobacterium muglaense]MBD3906473.1 hypothetical protein [Chryseobacterium muglaense]MCC9036816.1 hypothetical protein [Chryseobacterium muglaense]MCM2556142.1 hypothetical protein [Chryseobacterium muglaense]
MMTYTVKSGQTLAELCEELHLENPEYLRDFHNKNCPPAECCEGDIILKTRFFIPTAQQVAEINQEIRKNNESFYDFPDDGIFPWTYKLREGTYNISQTTYFNDEIINIYQQKIRLNFEEAKDNCCIFLFTAFDFRKNEETSDSKASTLATMCLESIYPIRMTVNSQGEIQNIELTKKAKQISSELETIKQFFEDDFSSDYIRKMKKIVEDPKEISRKFKNTLLNSFLFGSFYQTKLENWTTSQTYNHFYPWVSDAQPVCFELQNTLCIKENLNDDFLKIRQKGISCDYRSLEDLFLADSEYEKDSSSDENSIDCEHFAEYVFSRKNHSLQRIEATFLNFVNQNIEKEIFLLERAIDNF